MSTKHYKIIFLAHLMVLLVVYTLFYISSKDILTYSYFLILASIVYFILIWFLNRNILKSYLLFLVIALTILLKLLYFEIDPIGSDDYYRYLWDGKVQANGINPYQYAPNDPNLKNLHSEILPEKVSYPHIRTIYFPTSQMLFTIAYLISNENALGLKIILFIAEIIIIVSLYYFLKRLSIDLKYSLYYAVLPLVFFQFFLDAHIDLFGAALLLSSLTFYFYEKKIISYILLGLSISVKPLGLIILPFLFFNEQKIIDKIISLSVPIVIFCITFIPYIFTATPIDTLINYSVNWNFNGMIYNMLYLFNIDNMNIRIISGIIFLIAYIFLLKIKMNLLNKIYLSIFLLMIFSPVTHPWYLIWVAVLLPIIKSYSGLYFVSAISLTSITVVTFQKEGVWQESPLILILQYLPLTLIFLYELFKEKFWRKKIANP